MTAELLLQGVKSEPEDRLRWLVLADAYDDAGEHALAKAWRWMAETKRWPQKAYWREDKYDWFEMNANSSFSQEWRIPWLDYNWGTWFDAFTNPFDALVTLANDLALAGKPE